MPGISLMFARCWVAAGAVVLLLCGCVSQIGVKPVQTPRPLSEHQWCHGSARGCVGNAACREIIRRQQLEELIQKDPALALRQLHEAVSRGKKPGDTAVVAELTMGYAGTRERSQPEESLGMCLAAAALVYPHLASAGDAATDSKIVSIHNDAAAMAVRLLQALPGGMRANHSASACGQTFRVSVQAGDAASNPRSYDEWLPADHWNQHGLFHHYRNDGLGACLIAVRKNKPQSALEVHEPDEGFFQPSTAVLKFPPPENQNPQRVRAVSLVLYDPAFTPQVEVGGRRRALAGDFSTPWAMLLSHAGALSKTRWSAMVRPGETQRPHRLYLMEPYAPDRIPIIMVHGLHATPLSWEQMTNELTGDPIIRQRYQIWHYLYPTGMPFLTSAADFRDDLEEVRHLVDPQGRDFATQNMIIIAHSMGGLLTRTLVTESGDALWDSTFTVPITRLDPSLPQVPELRRMFYFHPKPYIKRVIFMSVPHRGSNIANGLVGRYVAGRVHLSDKLHAFIFTLRASVPDLLKPDSEELFKRGYPTSIRVLAPSTPGLVALAKLPVSRAVPFHSIMGDRGRGDEEKSSDGVVTYASAHLPGAESELLVPSNHRTVENPKAIAEVKRILLLHLGKPSTPSGRD